MRRALLIAALFISGTASAGVRIDGTTCLSVSSDRIFHDTDCDGTKDSGENFIDQTGGGGGSGTTIEVEDAGSSVVNTSTVNFRNGFRVVDDNGEAAVDVDFSSAASRSEVILLQDAIQSGATFYVSSGTVQNQFTVGNVSGSSGSMLRFDGSSNDPVLTFRQKFFATSNMGLSFKNDSDFLFGRLDYASSLLGTAFAVKVSSDLVNTPTTRFGIGTGDGIHTFSDARGATKFTVSDSSFTFNSGSDDPVLDWSTDGFLRVFNGTFTVSETLNLDGPFDAGGVGSDGQVLTSNGAGLAPGWETLSVLSSEIADGDHGDFTYTSGVAALDADVVAAAEMADADHGDVSWSGGVATVDNVAAANVAAGSLGSGVLASSVRLTIPGSDDTYTGISISTTAHENTAQWEVAFTSANARAGLADADSVLLGPAWLLATEAINAGSAGVYLVNGTARNDAWTWTPGGVLYLSATAGGITQTAPTGTDDVVQVLGIALSPDVIFWNPQLIQIELE